MQVSSLQFTARLNGFVQRTESFIILSVDKKGFPISVGLEATESHFLTFIKKTFVKFITLGNKKTLNLLKPVI